MRTLLYGIAVIVALVAVDYLVSGGFYTAKFSEMAGRIIDALAR